jgi:acetoin utilization deacetylase AcuC-like enzyme
MIGFFCDDIFGHHRTPAGHPERPARLEAVASHLKACGLWNDLLHLPCRAAPEEALLAVHGSTYLQYLQQVCAGGAGLIDDGDTYVVERSYEAASVAAGAVLGAVDAVFARQVTSAFCAVRPPGHHAEANCGMGFCLFNNVAVGARYAQRNHGIERVAVLDWDVHHGNGTQHMFENDPTVLYVSLHRYPFYPGTGARSERGIGKGEGFTLNIPLPAGTGEERYLEACTGEIIPALERFKPELLFISAGFDAHRDDPLGGMRLTEHSYGEMTSLIMDFPPVVSVLEGGYDLAALGRSVEAHLRAMEVAS